MLKGVLVAVTWTRSMKLGVVSSAIASMSPPARTSVSRCLTNPGASTERATGPAGAFSITKRPVPDVIAVVFVPSTVTTAPGTAAPVARAATVPVITLRWAA